MAQRLRLYDMRLSRLPRILGGCQGNSPLIIEYLNAAQDRLLQASEAGDEGWWGTFAEIRFNVAQNSPFITMPREVARVEQVAICNHPVPLRNQFYDYLQFGNGRMPNAFLQTIIAPGQTSIFPFLFSSCRAGLDVRSRNNVATFLDLTTPPQNVQVFPTNPADVGQRVLLQGLDPANNVIYTLDGTNNVNGQFVTLQSPFAQAQIPMNKITGVQKDITLGPIQIFQSDPTTSATVMISTMEPGETTAWYRRYFFNQLPIDCCGGATPSFCSVNNLSNLVQITAIVKLELIPLTTDTDYLLIQEKEALIHECQSVRYEGMDTPTAKQMSNWHHKQAIGLLNGQIYHYLGKEDAAVNFRPFGGAKLEHQRIGSLI